MSLGNSESQHQAPLQPAPPGRGLRPGHARASSSTRSRRETTHVSPTSPGAQSWGRSRGTAPRTRPGAGGHGPLERVWPGGGCPRGGAGTRGTLLLGSIWSHPGGLGSGGEPAAPTGCSRDGSARQDGYTSVSTRRRCILRTLPSTATRLVMERAWSSGNQPASPSRSLSPYSHPGEDAAAEGRVPAAGRLPPTAPHRGASLKVSCWVKSGAGWGLSSLQPALLALCRCLWGSQEPQGHPPPFRTENF